jgi:hypothetical protein
MRGISLSAHWWRLAVLAALVILAPFAFLRREMPPAAEAIAAQNALREAGEFSAGRWAVAEIDNARRLLDDAGREVDEENARFFFRSYARARTLLAAARADAEGARRAAELERDAAKSEAAEALKRARSMLDGARAALQIAPSPRDGRADLDRLRTELHSVEIELPEVDRLIDAGDFRVAAQKGSDLAARVGAAVSFFFNRMERGDFRVAAGERQAEARSRSRGRPALSLGLELNQEEGRPCSRIS